MHHPFLPRGSCSSAKSSGLGSRTTLPSNRPFPLTLPDLAHRSAVLLFLPKRYFSFYALASGRLVHLSAKWYRLTTGQGVAGFGNGSLASSGSQPHAGDE